MTCRKGLYRKGDEGVDRVVAGKAVLVAASEDQGEGKRSRTMTKMEGSQGNDKEYGAVGKAIGKSKSEG